MDPRLAFVIAHYHPRGRLSANFAALIRHLSTLTPQVVVVSTGLAEEGREALRPFARVIVRENVGYDFWSYKLGIDALGDRSALQRLVLCNSSIIVLDPKVLCSAFLTEVTEPALRGLTVNYERGLHAQSFWVAFEHGALINSDGFNRWWADMVPVSEREEVITRYEIGMSAYFAERGIPVRAAYTPTQEELLWALGRAIGAGHFRFSNVGRQITLDLDMARSLNPTHFLWDSLVARFSVLKLDLLLKNPMRMYLAPLFAQVPVSVEMHTLLREASGE